MWFTSVAVITQKIPDLSLRYIVTNKIIEKLCLDPAKPYIEYLISLNTTGVSVALTTCALDFQKEKRREQWFQVA